MWPSHPGPGPAGGDQGLAGSCGFGLLCVHVHPRALGPGRSGIRGPAQPSLAKGQWGACSGRVWVGLELVALVLLAVPFCGFAGRLVPCSRALCPEGLVGVCVGLTPLSGQGRPLGPTSLGASVGALVALGPGEEGWMLAEGGVQPPHSCASAPPMATVGCPKWSAQAIRPGPALAQRATAPGSRRMRIPCCPHDKLPTLHPAF